VTEARRIAELAALYALPFGLHDCSGPVNLAVGVHVSMSVENAFMQEIVRAYYRGWYQEVAVGLSPLRDGLIAPHDGPGHGIRLAPDLLDRRGTLVRRSIVA
jgi:L-alanine-DL-glutamate epimerase-like enolase superfamily enzyme